MRNLYIRTIQLDSSRLSFFLSLSLFLSRLQQQTPIFIAANDNCDYWNFFAFFLRASLCLSLTLSWKLVCKHRNEWERSEKLLTKTVRSIDGWYEKLISIFNRKKKRINFSRVMRKKNINWSVICNNFMAIEKSFG